MFGGHHPPTAALQEACRRAGLSPITFTAVPQRYRGQRGKDREPGARRRRFKVRIDEHAALMRERYGAVLREYDKHFGQGSID